MNAGTTLVLSAGGITFANEWLQTGHANFRVPIATLIGAAVVSGVGSLAPRAGTALGFMVLIVAATSEFNGKSAVSEFSAVLPTTTKKGK